MPSALNPLPAQATEAISKWTGTIPAGKGRNKRKWTQWVLGVEVDVVTVVKRRDWCRILVYYKRHLCGPFSFLHLWRTWPVHSGHSSLPHQDVASDHSTLCSEQSVQESRHEDKT